MNHNKTIKLKDLPQYRNTTEARTARVGVFDNGRLEVYVCANDKEQVPHVHISGKSEWGDWSDTSAVKLLDCHYYLHGNHDYVFTAKNKRKFARFMRAKPQGGRFRTNYELAIDLWNRLNPNAFATLKRHTNGRPKIPDYENLLPIDLHESRDFDMARFGFIDDNRYEVYVGTDDCVSRPHIHICDAYTLGREFIAAIYLKEPQYVERHSPCRLTQRMKELLISFLHSAPKKDSLQDKFLTKYEIAVFLWNSQNSDYCSMDLPTDANGVTQIPDYEQLPVIEEGENPFYNSVSLGRFQHNQYEAYISADDEKTPHVHVRDYNTMGQIHESVIDLRTNQYLRPHTECIMRHSQSKEFARFMLSKPDGGEFATNYELAVSLWNRHNPDAPMEPVRTESGQIVVPEYDDLWPLPDGDPEFDWWIHEYATVRWFNNERMRLLVTQMREEMAEKPYFKLMNYAEPNTRWARIRFDSPHYADGSADKYQWRLNADERRWLVTALRQPDGDRMYSPDGQPITLWQQLITSFNRENGTDLLPPDLPMPDYLMLE